MRLSNVFDGWGGYQTSLVHAIEPLSEEQLGWKPSEKVRSVGELARHISLGRINWFLRMKTPGSEELAAKIDTWDCDPHGNKYVVETALDIDRDAGALVRWLDATWEMIGSDVEGLVCGGLGGDLPAQMARRCLRCFAAVDGVANHGP